MCRLRNIIILLGLCVLWSCRSENDSDNVAEAPDEICLCLSGASIGVTQTRGTGTVGGTNSSSNNWNSENLYVLMTNIPSTAQPNWGYTVFEKLGEQFNGSFYCRPIQKGDKWYLDYESYTGNQKKYYPTDGTRSDFFAFYIDDSANSTSNGHPVIETSIARDTTKVVRFTLDGSQDLLAGKAIRTATDSLTDSKRGFSAKTARQGIVPNIVLEHLLTRFTFGVVPGHTNAEGVIVKSIKVISPNKGVMTVAYNENQSRKATELILWNSETSNFSLKEKATSTTNGKPQLVELSPVTLQASSSDVAKGQEVNIGEAMFVCPGQQEYKLFVTYLFPMGTSDSPLELTAELPVKLSGGKSFAQGSSYHIRITINGLSDIELKATLEQWKEGESIDMDTDEYFYPSHK